MADQLEEDEIATEVETDEGSAIFEIIPTFNPIYEFDYLHACLYILSDTSKGPFGFGALLRENWDIFKSELRGNTLFFGGIFFAKNIHSCLRALVARKIINFLHPEKHVYIGCNFFDSDSVVREIPSGSRYMIKIGANLFTIILFYPLETILLRCLFNHMTLSSVSRVLFSWDSFTSLYWGIGNELIHQMTNGLGAVIEELILYELARPQGWRNWYILISGLSLTFSLFISSPVQMKSIFLRTGLPYEFSLKRYVRIWA